MTDAAKRLIHYRAQIGMEFYCPRCWIDQAKHSTLVLVSSDQRDRIVMQCDCGQGWIIPIAD